MPGPKAKAKAQRDWEWACFKAAFFLNSLTYENVKAIQYHMDPIRSIPYADVEAMIKKAILS
jgi:hypothetical protein